MVASARVNWDGVRECGGCCWVSVLIEGKRRRDLVENEL